MPKKVIIADAGPLIAFGRIKQISLLKKTLGTIIAPIFVLNECLGNGDQSGAKEISKAICNKLVEPYEVIRDNQYQSLFDILGAGEASAIILASQLKIGLLMDDKLGRKIAQQMNLSIIGTAGALLLAKNKNLIHQVSPLIFKLKESGYYLSDELIKLILTKAKE